MVVPETYNKPICLQMFGTIANGPQQDYLLLSLYIKCMQTGPFCYWIGYINIKGNMDKKVLNIQPYCSIEQLYPYFIFIYLWVLRVPKELIIPDDESYGQGLAGTLAICFKHWLAPNQCCRWILIFKDDNSICNMKLVLKLYSYF